MTPPASCHPSTQNETSEALIPGPPSAELGEQLDGLAETRAAIDRKEAKELTRLRAIRDRD